MFLAENSDFVNFETDYSRDEAPPVSSLHLTIGSFLYGTDEKDKDKKGRTQIVRELLEAQENKNTSALSTKTVILPNSYYAFDTDGIRAKALKVDDALP